MNASNACRGLFIGGKWITPPGTLSVANPATGEPFAQAPLGGEEDLEAAVTAAQGAFPAARHSPPHERAALLSRITRELDRRRPEFVDRIVSEAGKPVTLAEAEVGRAITTFTIAAEEARRPGGEVLSIDAVPQGQGHTGFTRRFPIGLIYGLTPFNFPLNLVAHKVAPCIATGNVLILKPAPKTPLTALLLAEVLEAAGLPAGQVNVVPCPNELAGRLVGDPRVAMTSFTGSPSVGWELKQRCGRQRIVLELGGNAPVLIHEDADLPASVAAVSQGGFAYAGQSCISVQRILVHAPVYDRFRDLLLAHIRDHIKAGDPRDRSVVVGPMIDASALERIRTWIARAVSGGARVVTGGGVVGRCLEPTVLENVRPEMEVCCREVFAPVVTLQSYTTFAEGMAIANDSVFGLQAGVFTRDVQRAFQAFEGLDTGAVLINNVPTFRVEQMPYGGIKQSGFGREGIRWAMEEMTEIRSLIFKLQ
jgi:glyceraldehyde-3-phosphate dehydrogenase (NADP+)